jgi:hypothetical protein
VVYIRGGFRESAISVRAAEKMQALLGKLPKDITNSKAIILH